MAVPVLLVSLVLTSTPNHIMINLVWRLYSPRVCDNVSLSAMWNLAAESLAMSWLRRRTALNHSFFSLPTGFVEGNTFYFPIYSRNANSCLIPLKSSTLEVHVCAWGLDSSTFAILTSTRVFQERLPAVSATSVTNKLVRSRNNRSLKFQKLSSPTFSQWTVANSKGYVTSSSNRGFRSLSIPCISFSKSLSPGFASTIWRGIQSITFEYSDISL